MCIAHCSFLWVPFPLFHPHGRVFLTGRGVMDGHQQCTVVGQESSHGEPQTHLSHQSGRQWEEDHKPNSSATQRGRPQDNLNRAYSTEVRIGITMVAPCIHIFTLSFDLFDPFWCPIWPQFTIGCCCFDIKNHKVMWGKERQGRGRM